MRSVVSRIDLAKLFGELGYRIGAEIGVRGGRYSQVLCESISHLELYCVDSWGRSEEGRRGGLKEKHTKAYTEAVERLAPFKAVLIKKLSLEAVKDFANDSLDFIYLDAGHGFDNIMQDIISWSPKVRSGGMISGHDYIDDGHSGVVEAVNAYTKYHHLTVHLTDKNYDRGQLSWYCLQS